MKKNSGKQSDHCYCRACMQIYYQKWHASQLGRTASVISLLGHLCKHLCRLNAWGVSPEGSILQLRRMPQYFIFCIKDATLVSEDFVSSEVVACMVKCRGRQPWALRRMRASVNKNKQTTDKARAFFQRQLQSSHLFFSLVARVHAHIGPSLPPPTAAPTPQSPRPARSPCP